LWKVGPIKWPLKTAPIISLSEWRRGWLQSQGVRGDILNDIPKTGKIGGKTREKKGKKMEQIGNIIGKKLRKIKKMKAKMEEKQMTLHF
jgi:hypothetical protein